MTSQTYQRPLIGDPITDIRNVPKEIRDTAIVRAAPKNHKGEILKDDSGKPKLPQLLSAKENGSYRGPVILNSDKYLVQAVGQRNDFLILHEKGNLQLQGKVLPKLDAEKQMNGFNVQVHYSGAEARAYPYSPEKDAEKRQQTRAEQPSLTKEELSKQAQAYAQTIKNAKSREAFLNHISQLSSHSFQQPSKQAHVHKQEQKQPERA